MAFLNLVVSSPRVSLCPSPLKSSRPMVLTASSAGALTRRSATGNTTATRSSSGVCWPARRGPSRTIQVRVTPWPHAWHIFGYQGRFLTPVAVWAIRHARSIQSYFCFLELSRFLSLVERGWEWEYEFWLTLAGHWLAYLKGNKVSKGERAMLTFTKVNFSHIQWTQAHYTFSVVTKDIFSSRGGVA